MTERMSDENLPLAKDVERILDEESAFIARPSKAVTVRIALAAYMAAQKKITQAAKDVFARIEATICETHTMCDDGPRSRREGRISEADYDALTAMFTEVSEIDRLRSDLRAAQTVPGDGEVSAAINSLLNYDDEDPQGPYDAKLASLITRLASAERAAREKLEQAGRHIETLLEINKADQATAERDLAAMRERAEKAERELEKARADALEEAKSACLDLTGSDATPTLRPGARMCVRRIDHLKDQTP